MYILVVCNFGKDFVNVIFKANGGEISINELVPE